jgi:hypothetical protein
VPRGLDEVLQFRSSAVTELPKALANIDQSTPVCGSRNQGSDQVIDRVSVPSASPSRRLRQ